MRRSLRISLYGTFVLVASIGLLELGIRTLRRLDHGVRNLLYLPQISLRYDEFKNTSELLAQTSLGFNPGMLLSGFCLNSRGFLTPEYESVKAPGVVRIVALGDSFTFKPGGVPYGDQWTTRVGLDVGRSQGRKTEVINLGIPGVGPRFELRLWQLEARKLSPDVVVLAFFVGNDFTDESDSNSSSESKGTLAAHGWLLRKSCLYRLVRNLTLLRAAKRGMDVPRIGGPEAEQRQARLWRMGREDPNYPTTFDDRTPTMPDEEYLPIESARMLLTYQDRRPEFDRAFAFVMATLDALAKEVAEAGARFVVMTVPDEYQVDSELRKRAAASMQLSLDKYDVDLPQRELNAYFARKGVDSLDLLPAFRDAGRSRRLYRPCDSHWNIAGNALAADLLAAHLVSPR